MALKVIAQEDLSFSNTSNFEYAKTLFGEKGYCVIKGFLLPDEVKTIRDRYTDDENFYHRTHENYKPVSVRYMYKNKKDKFDEDVFRIARRAYTIKNQIALQPNSDQFVLSYCYRYGFDPEDLEALMNSQMNHTFIRIAKYKGGSEFPSHYDLPSELQCIIPLTAKGSDYEEGGLVLEATGDHPEVDVDALVEPGDLVILNSYRKKHTVKPIKCKENQIGRLHIFMPMIPEYIFARGRGYYHFQRNKWKIFFSVPTSRVDKCKHYIQHFLSLLTGKSEPIDSGMKG